MNQPMSEDRRLSPLFQRFNGIMFGFFASMASFSAAREQWPHLQAQMSRFVSEIQLDVVIPEQVDDFANRRGDILSAVLRLGKKYREFILAFGLGYSFAGLAAGVEVMGRTNLDAGMSALDLDPSALAEWIGNVSRDEQGRPNFDQVMTEGLNLTARVIAVCDPEPETCFVAMPFRDPYPVYYDEIYRSLLEAHGFRCVRAWGGMRNEAHNEMLLILIDRCGWVFAELTDANPNVAYELGFGTGRGKLTLAVMDTNRDAWVNWRVPAHPRLLSNLKGLAVLPYDSSNPAWREDLNDIGSQYVEAAKKIYTDVGALKGVKRAGRGSWLHRLFSRDKETDA